MMKKNWEKPKLVKHSREEVEILGGAKGGVESKTTGSN